MLIELDLREDKQFFIDHPGAVPISAAQVKHDVLNIITDLILNLHLEFFAK